MHRHRFPRSLNTYKGMRSAKRSSKRPAMNLNGGCDKLPDNPEFGFIIDSIPYVSVGYTIYGFINSYKLT